MDSPAGIFERFGNRTNRRGVLAALWFAVVMCAPMAIGQTGSTVGVTVPNATLILFDRVPPSAGTITSPARANHLPVTLDYTGAVDTIGGSGIQSATLWVKHGQQSAWVSTGVAANASSGTLAFEDAPADGPYYFAMQTEDRAGNTSPLPQGDGDTVLTLDREPPVITLLGSASVSLETGTTYDDPGAVATDNLDGNLSSAITIASNVNTAIAGAYQVLYTVSDAVGNQASATRTVTVGEGGPAQEFVWGDVNGDGVSGDSDAAAILQHRVGLLAEFASTSAEQAANVTGEVPAVVGTLDAALLLQRAGGSSTPFPADTNGDGSGPDTGPVFAAEPQALRNASMPAGVDGTAGADVLVPLTLDDAAGVLGYYATVAYDTAQLEFLGAARGSLGPAWVDPLVNATDGQVAVVAAGAEEATGSGTLLTLSFRARNALSADAPILTLAALELNDGSIPVAVGTTGSGPVLDGISPNRGAEYGGTVVALSGANLESVTQVLFGGNATPWHLYDETLSTLVTAAPAGTGVVDVQLISPNGAARVDRAYSYFDPSVYLSLTPPASVTAGSDLEVPIWLSTEAGVEPVSLSFRLRYDKALFAVNTGSAEIVVAGDSATNAGKTTDVKVLGPGQLQVSVAGSANATIKSGLLCTCRLKALGDTADAVGLIYITGTNATGVQSKALTASEGLER